MRQDVHQAQLADVARWCHDQTRGILTAAGLPKKPYRYLVVKCSAGHMTLQKRGHYVDGKEGRNYEPPPKPCDYMLMTKEPTNNSSAPRTAYCKRATEIVEEITP